MVEIKRINEKNVDNWLYYIKILEKRKNKRKRRGEKISMFD